MPRSLSIKLTERYGIGWSENTLRHCLRCGDFFRRRDCIRNAYPIDMDSFAFIDVYHNTVGSAVSRLVEAILFPYLIQCYDSTTTIFNVFVTLAKNMMSQNGRRTNKVTKKDWLFEINVLFLQS